MPQPLKILFEDNHLLVIDKPALLPTMGVSEGEDSLIHRAKGYLRKKYNKPGNVYLGVVSRLDSHVSGLIVIARTTKAARRLSDQFRRRTPKKIYLAIVAAPNAAPNDLKNNAMNNGGLPQSGVLEHRMIKNESQHRMMTLPDGAAPHRSEKTARLAYRILGFDGGQQLLEIELETGRKHQIRVQLAAVGCHIVGDRKYDSTLRFPTGIALHAHRLAFEHPTKKTLQSFQSDPPSFWNLARFGYDRE